MHIVQKKSYDQDINLFEDLREASKYGVLLLLLIAAPFVLAPFYVKELALVFVLSIAGLSLMLLVGYTGMVSLGHGAILGLGAYTQCWLMKHGVPFLLSLPLAALVTGVVSTVVSFPALRLSGMYLAIATLAISLLLTQVFTEWSAFTGGLQGIPVPKPSVFGASLAEPVSFYLFCLLVTTICFIGVKNLLRTRTGRAFIALRDSAVAARSMGINEVHYKALAFFASSAFAGLSGAMLAHYVGFISPDSFDFLLSVKLLILIVVGGMGSLPGAALGAAFVVLLPQVTSLLKDAFPGSIAGQPSLETVIFGVILVGMIVWEPYGIFGRWLKIKHYFTVFPTYRKATFVRQKTFVKTERMR